MPANVLAALGIVPNDRNSRLPIKVKREYENHRSHHIGNAAANLQTSVRTVERVAAKLRLEPVLLLDHVRHFDGTD